VWNTSHADKNSVLVVACYRSPIGIAKMKKYFIPGYPE